MEEHSRGRDSWYKGRNRNKWTDLGLGRCDQGMTAVAQAACAGVLSRVLVMTNQEKIPLTQPESEKWQSQPVGMEMCFFSSREGSGGHVGGLRVSNLCFL